MIGGKNRRKKRDIKTEKVRQRVKFIFADVDEDDVDVDDGVAVVSGVVVGPVL